MSLRNTGTTNQCILKAACIISEWLFYFHNITQLLFPASHYNVALAQ